MWRARCSPSLVGGWGGRPRGGRWGGGAPWAAPPRTWCGVEWCGAVGHAPHVLLLAGRGVDGPVDLHDDAVGGRGAAAVIRLAGVRAKVRQGHRPGQAGYRGWPFYNVN